MTKKILLGGLVGGVVIFVVLSIWHMATGLGDTGMQSLPNDDAVMAVMRASIHEPGLYFFPGMNMSKSLTKEQQKAEMDRYNARAAQGPAGLMVIHPEGEEFHFGKLLVNEFLLDVACGLLAAWILGFAASGTSYGARVLIVFLVGLAASLGTDVQYWNWYEFPTAYTLAHMGGFVVSYAAAGLAMAAIVKR